MLKKLFYILLVGLVLIQCRKDPNDVSDDPSIKLSFSDQVVLFDTIFTTVGSTTRWLKVYNNSGDGVNISDISITGPGNAFFRMNVDGESGSTVKDVFLASKDSLWIFIDVTIDPNSSETLPFIVEGQIEFVTNGNVQKVDLVAYGQQAYFITPTNFVEGLPNYSLAIKRDGYNLDTTWTNELPIVVYGYVVVDSTHHLTIEKGTQIYFHANSGLWVYRNGQLTVNGTKEEPVVFQGDRLDNYKDIAGSWDRIWINDGEFGKDNNINYAIIKHSFIGIQAEYDPFSGAKNGWAANQINLTNTVIENAKFAGIYALNHKILGQNLLVSNSGNSNLIVSGGGAYLFQHCTFANYWRSSIRSTPAVFLTQLYYDFEQQAYRQDSMEIDFKNTIIYGDRDHEFGIEDEVDPGEKIQFRMNQVLFKSEIDVSKYGEYNDTIFNREDLDVFLDPYDDDFHLTPGTPAIDFGDNSIITNPPTNNPLIMDLDGESRNDGKPDLGAYEFQ